MKTFRRTMTCLLAGLLALSFVGCGSANPTESGSGSGEKKEPILLTYASWDESPVTEYLVQKYMELNDNVTVEIAPLEQGTWESGLFNLASTGDLPDVFWTFDLGAATANGWTLDITELYNNDPYTAKIPQGIQEAGVYNGKRYGTAVWQFPWVAFINKTLFEQMNVPLPNYNWTLEDFSSLVKQLSVPGQNIYGVNGVTDYFYKIFPVLNTEEICMWGFNPKTQDFDYTQWAEGYKFSQDLLSSKYASDFLTGEEKEKLYGKADIWMPETGKVGIQMDWYWTTKYMKSDAFTGKGIEWLVYPAPMGSSGRTQTTVDLGAVSATTKHPEEAYKLLQFMTFGREGWLTRIEYFKNNNAKPAGLPLANDEDVWNALLEVTPGDDYENLYNSLGNAVSETEKWLPGFSDFWAWTWEQDIWGQLTRGEVKPEDLVSQMNSAFKKFYDDGMTKINAR